MSRLTTALAGSVLLLALAGCAGTAEAPSSAETSPSTEQADKDSGATAAPMISADDFAVDRFTDPTAIDHPWYPLRPGKQLLYRGSSLEDGERLHHTVDITVTDLTKVVSGVRTVVVWERDYTEGELVETELATFAQDSEGYVWHLGQYPEEYEEGELVEAPAWVHGLKGATAGITIPAEPRVGTPDFAQGFAPAPLNWIDRGRVYRTGQRTCVPAGCYDDVVVIEEFERTIPDAYQDKFYAPGIGVVRVGWRGSNDESKEVLELVEINQLAPARLAAAREGALELEDRAYRTSKDVWARTERSQPPA